MMTLVNLKNCTKSYGDGLESKVVLDNVSLTIQKGEYVGIVGNSGEGKSTLLNTIGLLSNFDRGCYEFKGKRIDNLNNSDKALIRNKEIGFVFQSFNLIKSKTVIENVMQPLVYGYVSKAERIQRAQQKLEYLGLIDKLNNFPNELSGGEKQRVAIARALINDPTLLVADEPTGNLDSDNTNKVLDLLKELNNANQTVLIVSHDEKSLIDCTRLVKISNGKVV